MATYNLFGTTTAPTYFSGTFNLGTEFMVTTTNAWLIGLRLYRASTSVTGTPTGRVYSVTTATTGSAVAGTDATFALGSTTGWKEAETTQPILLTQNQRYRVAIRFPSGFSAVNSYWASGAGASGITNGPLYGFRYSSPQVANSSIVQGSYNTTGTLAFPNTIANPSGNNYFCDVTITDVDPTAAPQNHFFPVNQP